VASYFLDSSAVVKRYVQETGSGWVRELMARPPAHDLYLARITAVEVVSALIRHIPALTPADLASALAHFQDHLRQRFRFIAVNGASVSQGMLLAIRHRLRGYDALQLAAVIEARTRAAAAGSSEPAFISADVHLNRAAASEGFSVDNPNAHP